MLLKDLLRGRGILLIEDRTDIVGAAEADGVVLSRQGDIFSARCGRHMKKNLTKNASSPFPQSSKHIRHNAQACMRRTPFYH